MPAGGSAEGYLCCLFPYLRNTLLEPAIAKSVIKICVDEQNPLQFDRGEKSPSRQPNCMYVSTKIASDRSLSSSLLFAQILSCGTAARLNTNVLLACYGA